MYNVHKVNSGNSVIGNYPHNGNSGTNGIVYSKDNYYSLHSGNVIAFSVP